VPYFTGQMRELRDGMKGWFADVLRAFPDWHGTIDHLIADGDKVVAFFTWTGTHEGDYLGIPATGRTITLRTADLFRVADGRLAEHLGPLSGYSNSSNNSAPSPLQANNLVRNWTIADRS
jgi:steroid delta-isomerase-like uncharacterized protein